MATDKDKVRSMKPFAFIVASFATLALMQAYAAVRTYAGETDAPTLPAEDIIVDDDDPTEADDPSTPVVNQSC
jgi:hypothetical protein